MIFQDPNLLTKYSVQEIDKTNTRDCSQAIHSVANLQLWTPLSGGDGWFCITDKIILIHINSVSSVTN